eukprot:SAG31_NODE_7767_length_1601_cov_1.908123_1_plen_222_part_00
MYVRDQHMKKMAAGDLELKAAWSWRSLAGVAVGAQSDLQLELAILAAIGLLFKWLTFITLINSTMSKDSQISAPSTLPFVLNGASQICHYIPLLFLIATCENAWFGIRTVCQVEALAQVVMISGSLIQHGIHASPFDNYDAEHFSIQERKVLMDEVAEYNGNAFASLASFIAFRLITYRVFKFKQDSPSLLFSGELHGPVPGSPLAKEIEGTGVDTLANAL